MAGIERFEDLEAWQDARLLARRVYGCTSQGSWSRDFGLRDQIQRAAVSVLSNVAEGFERRSNAEFHRFLAIAKGSTAEVKAQLYVAADLGYIEPDAFAGMYELADKTSRKIGGLMNYLKSKPRPTNA